MNVTKMTAEDFKKGARDCVLEALDEYMRRVTGYANALGARDEDLPKLFPALDAHMDRVAARFNDPESKEPGSLHFSVIY